MGVWIERREGCGDGYVDEEASDDDEELEGRHVEVEQSVDAGFVMPGDAKTTLISLSSY